MHTSEESLIFGIHGGGNIGLGLMADVVSKSPHNYKVLATSSNSALRERINKSGKVYLRHPDGITCIKNIQMIGRELPDISELYTKSSIIAICVTPTIIPEIVNSIAQALIERDKQNSSKLTILLLMNHTDSEKYVSDHIYTAMLAIKDINESDINRILSNIKFVPTVIDRVVTSIPETAIFNAEKNFSIHATPFPEAHHFPAIQIVSSLKTISEIKNKLFNGPHAVLAWYAKIFNHSTISQAITNPIIYANINNLMEEIIDILTKAFPEVSKDQLERYKQTFLTRCATNKEDTTARVARDPKRKLNSGNGVRGALELAHRRQLPVSTEELKRAIAVGFLYALNMHDHINPGCPILREIYELNSSSFWALLHHNHTASGDSFIGFCPERDLRLIQEISSRFHTLSTGAGACPPPTLTFRGQFDPLKKLLGHDERLQILPRLGH